MSKERERGLSIRARLTLIVYDRSGKVKKVHEQPANLALNNFLYFTRIIMGGVSKQSSGVVGPFTDEGGNTVHVVIGYDSNCWDYAANADKQFYVECGTGTTSPSGSDYKLENKLADGKADVTEVSTTASPPYVKLSGTIDIPSDATVTEIGLSLECVVYEPASGTYPVRRILLIRDLLDTAIDVFAGDRIEVTYQINIKR